MTAPKHQPNLTLPTRSYERSPKAGPLAITTANRMQMDLKDLLHGGSELQIVHEEQIYTLRLTRNNKLILTK
jgi:hemin uptake protein HemP